MQDSIIIRGARQHNLKNINLELPKNKLIVFTGISGSGKSSLAFDTIYAEGQRRYVESLSSYARQFLGIMDKPDVETIEGLSPAISIDQKSVSHNPRSTVGTITEIYDYLRLLFARIVHPHFTCCKREVLKLTNQQIAEQTFENIIKKEISSISRPLRLLIISPIIRDRKGEFQELFERLKMKGFVWLRIDKQIFNLNEKICLIKTNKHSIDAVIDRITVEKKIFKDKEKILNLKQRLVDSIEQATELSEGLAIVTIVQDSSFDFPKKPKKMIDYLFSQLFSCPVCNISIPEIEPRIFSFNSPHGACPNCAGLGSLLKIDPKRILNTNLSILEGAILPFARMIFSDTWLGRILTTVASSNGIDLKMPLKQSDPEKIEALLFGTGEKIYQVSGTNRYGKLVTIYEKFPGIIPILEKRYMEAKSEFIRHDLGKYLKKEICPNCSGRRLKKEAMSITIDNKTIFDIVSLSVEKFFSWIVQIENKLSPRETAVSKLIIKEIKNRLSFLLSVGLGYLTLERSAFSLAGGETQRIRLASQIGSGLSGVLYVLDEPSIGLHPRDNYKLINTLKNLRDLGNTVIVVEHDREIMENADLIVDFGPKAGEEGGNVVAMGKVDSIKQNKQSLTGKYLSNKKVIRLIQNNYPKQINPSEKIIISGCRENNLKNIKVVFPLKKFICVTGVSGSGKSSLVVDTLYSAVASYLNPYYREKVGKFSHITGLENIKKVILVDQSPIGRTPRSNPATYTGVFTFIRDLYSQTASAKERGFKPSRFSFNVKGGRCEACQGEGLIKIEMQFMPDVYITCDVCKGTRYNNETLSIKYKEKNIADILNLSVKEAIDFFANIPSINNILMTLNEVGLSYIKLGQPAPQLSGGEAQRIKLASELSKKSISNILYILDEPTTGLHFADLEKLLVVLKKLVDMGNTVIVIEHNLDVIKNSDWIIDLGPEGGEAGGYVVAEGTCKEIIDCPSSYTGKYLKKVLF